jgi:hypothetical protein
VPGGSVALGGGSGGLVPGEGGGGGEGTKSGDAPDGGCEAAGGAAGAGDGPGRFGPPWDRKAAAFVMRRDPHPGQVTMLSGSERGPIEVLQRGQFIGGGRASIS